MLYFAENIRECCDWLGSVEEWFANSGAFCGCDEVLFDCSASIEDSADDTHVS
jgi:hypothetical protein